MLTADVSETIVGAPLTHTPSIRSAAHPVATVQAEARLPTRFGSFRIAAYSTQEGEPEIVALVHGHPDEDVAPLVRLHSECLTGDALGSLRCDCGEQLQAALARIAAAGSGVLLYLPQEGRGIGIANKIRAYALQDTGLDTVDANLRLGLPVDSREYASAAAVLREMGLRQVRLLTNNPLKVNALDENGVHVVERVALEVVPNDANAMYLHTKADRLGHLLGEQPEAPPAVASADGTSLTRPMVTVHYAQTLDGRLATRTGNSQWISGDDALRLAHQLRASHQAILVGVGTVLADNPRLTVRLADGASPIRVVVDSTLRLRLDARVLGEDAASTIVATTTRAPEERIQAVQAGGAQVLVAAHDAQGHVSLPDLFGRLAARGLTSLLVEGGGGIITSVLRDGLVDRLVVCIAPKVIGSGIDAIGNLDILRLSDALAFVECSFRSLGPDVVFDGRIDRLRSYPDLHANGARADA